MIVYKIRWMQQQHRHVKQIYIELKKSSLPVQKLLKTKQNKKKHKKTQQKTPENKQTNGNLPE